MPEQEPGTDATEPSGADPYAMSGPASSWSAILNFTEESADAADAWLCQPSRNRNCSVAASVRASTASLRTLLREARRCPLPDDRNEPDTIDQTTEAHALTVWPALVRELDESTQLFRSIVSDDLRSCVKSYTQPESLSGYWALFDEEWPFLSRRLGAHGEDGRMEGDIAAVFVKGRWPSARDMVLSLARSGTLPYAVQVLAHETGHASLEGSRGRVNRWLLALLVPALLAAGVLGGWFVLAEACLVSTLVVRWRTRRAADSALHESVAHAFESGVSSGETRDTWHRRLGNHWCVQMHGQQGVADAREAFDLLRTGWGLGINTKSMIGAIRHKPRAKAIGALRAVVMAGVTCPEETEALGILRTLDDCLTLMNRCRVIQIVRGAVAPALMTLSPPLSAAPMAESGTGPTRSEPLPPRTDIAVGR